MKVKLQTRAVVRRWIKSKVLAAMHTLIAEVAKKKKLCRIVKIWSNRCINLYKCMQAQAPSCLLGKNTLTHGVVAFLKCWLGSRG